MPNKTVGAGGLVRLIVWGIVALAVVILVQMFPSVTALISPSLHSRSTYCTRWLAMRDYPVEMRQSSQTAAIARECHLIRREGGLSLWATPQGEYWIPTSDDAVLPLLLAQANREIYGAAGWGVRPGDVVLDAGAYIGTWARWALAHGAKVVVEIEPTPASVECLRRNLAGELASGRAILVPKGIWDSDGVLRLHENPDNSAGNSFLANQETGRAVDVPVTTVDSLASDLDLPRVDFIKADIKGATERLIRGGARVIARDRPRLAFSTEEPGDDAAKIAALAKKVVPAYEIKCGPCLLDGREIYTDVLFFR